MHLSFVLFPLFYFFFIFNTGHHPVLAPLPELFASFKTYTNPLRTHYRGISSYIARICFVYVLYM